MIFSYIVQDVEFTPGQPSQPSQAVGAGKDGPFRGRAVFGGRTIRAPHTAILNN